MSRGFYTKVLDGETVRDDAPPIVALANTWVIINTGGGPSVASRLCARSRRFLARFIRRYGYIGCRKRAQRWQLREVIERISEDKPEVTLEPSADPDRVSSFLSVLYQLWAGRGAQFLTPPADRGPEIRCYLRDPDGHLIEVGQLTATPQAS